MLRRSYQYFSAKDISLRGSEWTRLLLRTTASGSSLHCNTWVHIFPMLHVASVKFYDSVLEEIQGMTRAETESPTLPPFYALLEGILSSPQQRMLDAQEFNTIYYDKSVRSRVSELCCGRPMWEASSPRPHVGLGMGDSLYPEATLRDICNKELNLGYNVIVDYNKQKHSTLKSEHDDANLLHLQDAYFKPLLATIAGGSMLSADVTESELMKGLGTSDLDDVPLHKLPQQRVKAFREEHVANYLLHIVLRQSMLKQVEFASNEQGVHSVPLCNIGVLWGHYHTDGILDALRAQINDINAKGTALMTIEEGPSVYRTLSYGVPEALLTKS